MLGSHRGDRAWDVGLDREVEQFESRLRGLPSTIMSDTPVAVGDGPNRYFSLAGGKKSSWTLPPNQLDEWLNAMQARADEKMNQQRNSTDMSALGGGGNNSVSMRNLLSKSIKTDLKKLASASSMDQDWAVRLHPDTGQVYYENKTTAETTWFNPIAASPTTEALTANGTTSAAVESPLAAIFAENWMEWDDRREEELEEVAGFDALVDRSRFEKAGSELRIAGSRLDKWLGRRGIEVTETDSLAIKWAEYANPERKLNITEAVEVRINLEDYPQLPQKTVRLGAPWVSLATTVRELHELLFSRICRQTDAGTISIDPAWVKGADNSEIYGRYVYKVVGCTDYLIHQSHSLGFFDHVATSNARRVQIELSLVKLSEGDALDLADRMGESVAEVLAANRAHHSRTDDDDFRQDRNEEAVAEAAEAASSSPTEAAGGGGASAAGGGKQGGPSSMSSAWVSSQRFPLEDINWSFRMQVRGLSGLNAAIPNDIIEKEDPNSFAVQVQVALCSSGQLLKPPQLASGKGRSPQGGAHGQPTAAQTQAQEAAMMDSIDWDSPLCLKTQPLLFSNGGFDQEWPTEWLAMPLKIRSLPYASRVCFRVVLKRLGAKEGTKEARPVVLGGVSLSLIKFNRQLIGGAVKAFLWPSELVQEKRDKDIADGEKDPQFLALESRTVGENPEKNCGCVHVTFDTYELPVVAKRPCYNDYRDRLTLEAVETTLPPSMPPNHEQSLRLKVIENSSPLRPLTEADKHLVFASRDWVCEHPLLLPRLVEAVDWVDPRQVDEGRMCLVKSEEHVKANSAELAMLQFLDVKYGDPVVREFAVRQLDRLNDSSLAEVLLQLTQVMKYEAEHDSPLGRMLLRRAIKSPLRIGQLFFWMLRSEMHVHAINDRYGLYLKLYLHQCGPHKSILAKQLFVNEALTSIAQQVHNVRPKKAQKYNEFVQRELKKLDLPPRFSLCHAPRVELTAAVIEKASVMTSKKLPLRLDFVNADPHARGYYRALFKCGDDLRQDLLTLQVLSVMERLWIESGMQPRMIPYKCASAGDQLGFIEWVTESTTTAWVQTHYGGKYGALKKENMRKHLAHHNKSTAFDDATQDFSSSCASYCVATYVLGIGDRHSDNIMVKENGMLFHIDFGHFLGNFKSKFGVKRERDNFVFTPDFCYVMGGAYVNNFGNVVEGDDRNLYDKFEKQCGRCYNVLRENKAFLMNLFLLMIPAGMPELTARSDVAFMDDKLMLGLTPEDAATHFGKEIKKALNTITRRIDNLAHTVKHYK